VHVAPERRHAVDVAAAFGVDEVGALGALDDQGLLLLPPPLLGERVPEIAAVVVDEAHAAKLARGVVGTGGYSSPEE
jgi:hypothetical protein